jgi:hypothetical protein
MELRWTQEAAADLERIADYLFEHTLKPCAGTVYVVRILQGAEQWP